MTTEAQPAPDREPEKLIAAQKVVEHLREFGPNARVMLLGGNGYDMQYTALEGKEGLLTLYGDEFTGKKTLGQMTHKDGGVIYITHVARVNARPNEYRGLLFSMLWTENVDLKLGPDNEAYMLLAARNRLGGSGERGGKLIMSFKGAFTPGNDQQGRISDY